MPGQQQNSSILARLGAAGKADGEAAAAGMAAERDRAFEMLLAKVADQIGDVVLELADVFDVAAVPPGLVVPAQVGQHDLRHAAEAQGRRQPVIAGAVIGRAVHEDQDAVRGGS